MSELTPDLSRYQNRFGWRNKFARILWQLVWMFLYRPSPLPFHGWRCCLLRCFGAKIGKGVHPYPAAKIWAPWNLEMGDYSCLADGVQCYSVAAIRLGRGVLVSQRTFLCSASHDYTHPDFSLTMAPIIVGDGAWVAAEAFVGPGVTIGEGAVIGARACVFNDVLSWTVVVGNPSRVLKMRALIHRAGVGSVE